MKIIDPRGAYAGKMKYGYKLVQLPRAVNQKVFAACASGSGTGQLMR